MRYGIFANLKNGLRLNIGVLVAVLAVTSGLMNEARAADAGEIAKLRDVGATVVIDSKTGAARFVGFDTSTLSPSRANPALQSVSAQATALQHLSDHGVLFGLIAPGTETKIVKHATRLNQRTMTRFQQIHQALPVIGGELIVNQTADRQLTSISGRVSSNIKLDLIPAISAKQAEDVARQSVSKWYALPESELDVSPAELSVYDSKLISPHSDPVALVWRMDVTPVGGLHPIKEFIGVDAKTGLILIHFNQVPHAKNRLTYDNLGVRNNSLPGSNLVCNESNPGCTGGTQDAIDAHRYAGATYDYYLANFGRDSIDGLGMSLISTVRFCYVDPAQSCPYQNAFWNGSQMVYGAGFSKGEDVVGHELTHGVTSKESKLYYYYQSGAINESFSDVFGELIQQSDPATTVTPATKWLLAEDLSIGTIRNMANPPAFSDPDKMTSIYYYTGTGDNGGVHTNSGINNKAAYLMTDGGTFNGKTVIGLGPTKVAHIYYETQINLLTSGSDYLDLYYALYQGCQNLINSYGISSNDCQQVRNATDAVEMSLQPVSNFNPEAGVCPAGLFASNTFIDGLESGGGNWTVSGTSNIWFLQSYYAKTGSYGLVGRGYGSPSPLYQIDGKVTTSNYITVPAGAYLRFDHAFSFETGYDGGIVEYSADGTTWTQLTSFIDGQGFYASPISSSYLNPIGGKYAFSGESHGYVSSRFDLSSIAGSKKFRWRIGTDSSGESTGWFVDNVQVYTCVTLAPTAPPVINSITAGGGKATINFTAGANNNGSPVTGYTATCSALGQPTRTQTGSGSPIVVSGLKGGISYSCSVQATNSAGASPASNAQAVIPVRNSIVSILMLLLN